MIKATFYVEPLNKKVIDAIIKESSTGTWTDVKAPARIKKLTAEVLEKDKNTVVIGYPDALFEPNNIPQMLACFAGNIFGMKMIKNLRLVSLEVSTKLAKTFPGPMMGIPGIRQYLGTKKRPHIGTIVKPKVGLNPKETAKRAYEAWVGGVDFVKDDENLGSQAFCPFEDRVVEVLEALERAEEETGEKKLYSPNVTAPFYEMLERADFVKEHGGNMIMIDFITAGFSAFQSLRFENILPIHVHRTMHAAFTRNPKHGIAMNVLATLVRLAGGDQLHVGAVFGKMEGDKEEVRRSAKNLTRRFAGLKPVFPVASGGLHPALVPEVIDFFGTDVVIQAGGGIHGHPDGTRAGAAAMRQAVEATLKGIPLKEYAKDHKELAKALKKWKA